ncbi:hypothetical protein OG746_38595 [Streptomyces sp. NBC_01016]|uniref:hypothetical protein n=1 Tax=Streptomyces sp. NBC_01016 TaxID=2903720 RepID=UPI00224D139B|nr:hypothetical protein [Streptomyces sp. NBC_01016]MCX4834614.1 hypothetical protein [Streptomyces sp. NBC_01016]
MTTTEVITVEAVYRMTAPNARSASAPMTVRAPMTPRVRAMSRAAFALKAC